MTTVCAIGVPPLEPAANFYVSTTGDDNNSGTFNNPFATFEHARSEVELL